MAHRVFSQPCRPVKFQKFFQQQGLALPTVLALSILCSVLLLACWRNIALSQGWSRSSVERWQLRQAALSGICKAATAISSPAAQANNNMRLSYPVDAAQWAQLQTRLPVNGCVQGICRPLLHLSNHRSDWLNRTSGAHSLPDQGDISLVYWVEILPTTSIASQRLCARYLQTIAASEQPPQRLAKPHFRCQQSAGSRRYQSGVLG